MIALPRPIRELVVLPRELFFLCQKRPTRFEPLFL
jgi:hypothetical protein